MSIQIQNLGKIFPDKKVAVKDLNITFKKNKITGLIGFNGSGKTTTFNLLVDFLDKTTGKIIFDGIELNSKNKKEFYKIKETISYLSAEAETKNSTKAISHLYSIAFLYNVPKKEAYNKIIKLSKRIEFMEFLQKPIKSLSKGNQQKIKVISALLNPKLKYLFLDEPFDGLDPIMVEKIKKIFLEIKEVTMIITSHRMEVIQTMCEEFYVLKEGILIDSKKTSDLTISISINKEVPISIFKDLKCILSIKKEADKINIIADNIQSFKLINAIAIKSSKFLYCSLEKKNIAQTVFEGYGV